MDGDGFADQFDRFIVTPTLMGNHSQQMQRVGMMRIDLEDLAVEIFSIVPPAGLMMLKRFCLHCLDPRQLPVP